MQSKIVSIKLDLFFFFGNELRIMQTDRGKKKKKVTPRNKGTELIKP